MRLVISVLGLPLLDVELTADVAADEDPAAALNGGECGASVVGFTATFEQPDEVGLPGRDY